MRSKLPSAQTKYLFFWANRSKKLIGARPYEVGSQEYKSHVNVTEQVFSGLRQSILLWNSGARKRQQRLCGFSNEKEILRLSTWQPRVVFDGKVYRAPLVDSKFEHHFTRVNSSQRTRSQPHPITRWLEYLHPEIEQP